MRNIISFFVILSIFFELLYAAKKILYFTYTSTWHPSESRTESQTSLVNDEDCVLSQSYISPLSFRHFCLIVTYYNNERFYVEERGQIPLLMIISILCNEECPLGSYLYTKYLFLCNTIMCLPPSMLCYAQFFRMQMWSRILLICPVLGQYQKMSSVFMHCRLEALIGSDNCTKEISPKSPQNHPFSIILC